MEEREPGWNAAHGYLLPPEPDNAAIRWGTAFEDAVVELAERAQGKKIAYREEFFSINETTNAVCIGHTFAGYISCHVDGIYLEKTPRDRSTLHEGKTTSAFTFREKWGEPGTDHIPRPYQVQVQHQMLCTGAEEAVVSVLVFPETPDKWEAMGWYAMYSNDVERWHLKRFNSEGYCCVTASIDRWADVLSQMGYFHQYPVRANPEAQRLMVEVYRDFWHKNVLTGTPPEPRNYEDAKRLFPEPKSTIIASPRLERLLIEYKAIVEETANTKKRKEHIKTVAIIEAAKNQDGVIDDESKEAVIFRNGSGDKLGSLYKNKNGTLFFRC
jgi:predicted phage-related endonuclease